MWNRIKGHRYIQGTAEATSSVYRAFTKRRRQLIRLSLESATLTFLSLAIVGTQLFYPFHVIIGVGVYILSFVPFAYRIYLSRDTWREYHAYKLTTNFVKKERLRLFLTIIVFVLVAVFLWLRPLDDRPFAALTNAEIVALVEDDMYRAVTAMDYLESTGNELLAVLERSDEDSNHTEDITEAFTTFLDAVRYSESLTETHRYFASIPYSEWDARLESFLIANSLYVKKYEMVHRIIVTVLDSDHKKKALNQYLPDINGAGVYTEMSTRFYHPKTRVRLTGGFLYQSLFVSDDTQQDTSFALLRDKAKNSYEYLRTNFDDTLMQAPEVLGDGAEEQMFTAWFPIQKGVATAIGRAIISTRGNEGLITPEQARVMGEEMVPGDIMLQRRNWHVSNVGIPGFWTHAALYTGTLDQMDAYFASEFPYGGHDSMSAYMAAEAPAAYQAYVGADKSTDQPSVIEAIEPGVVAQTLPVSANADFVVVLRPKLSKQDKLLALLRAFGNTGKPYDFNFDFDTRDALVCSELVYDAYFERPPDKAGLQMETSVVNGRPIVTPFDIATKYVTERDTEESELAFVYFLRSNEETGVATVSDEVTFVESLDWSKFSFLQGEG